MVEQVDLNPGAEAFLDEREDYYEDFWQYSRFALPWLLFILLLLFVVFGLTFWQQTGNIKQWFDGVPRVLQRTQVREDKLEGGMDKPLRNIRIASFSLIIPGVIIAFLAYFMRPKPGIRKGLCFFASLLLLIGAVCAWIGFGVGLAKFHRAERCDENWRFTHAKCHSRENYAITEVAIDAATGGFAAIAFVMLLFNTIKGHWRMAPRSWEEEQRDREVEAVKERAPGELIHKNVSFVRKWLTGIFLFAALIAAIVQFVFVIILHEDRDVEYLRGPRGRAFRTLDPHSIHPYEHGGWPKVNTRIRYGAVGIGIMTVFLNFLPFRSKTVALLFALAYFATATALLVAFGFDVHELRRAGKLPCPTTVDGFEITCAKSSFIATACIEFIAVVAILIYLIIEYIVFRGKVKTDEYIVRPYGVFSFEKREIQLPAKKTLSAKSLPAKTVSHMTYQAQPETQMACSMCGTSFAERELAEHVEKCSCRPVICDACGETFRARDYMNHRNVCAEVLVKCALCDDELQRFRMTAHQQSECPKRMVLCDFCGDAFQSYKLDRHRVECHCRPN
jgi:hypothetical protein